VGSQNSAIYAIQYIAIGTSISLGLFRPQLHKGQGPRALQIIAPETFTETNFVDQSKREATTANAD
jgi:hypothetical protein